MRKKVSAEFKRECAELVTIYGHTQKAAALAMNVGLSSIRRWVDQYQQEQAGITPKSKALTPEQQRIQELEKELKQVKSDNELLKKASAFFAIEMNKNR